MKISTKLFLIATMVSLFFSACMKDTATKQYKLFTPIVEKMVDLKAKIKTVSGTPVVNAGKLFVIGNYIFLSEREKGIHIIDNTNPSNPINKGFIIVPGNTDFIVNGNILYANCYTDLITINITNINNIDILKTIEDIFSDIRFINGYSTTPGNVITGWIVKDTTVNVEIGEGQGIWSNGKYLTNNWSIGTFGGGFNPTATSNSNTVNGKAGSMSRFAMVNNYLYTVSNSTLSSLNIAPNTGLPTVSNKQSIGWNIETIFPFKDKLFIGSQTGMSIYNVSNASHPVYISGFSHARLCDPVIADDNYAYITLHAGTFCQGTQNELNVINIKNITNPILVKQINLQKPQGLSKDGNLLFVCDDDAGIKVFDAMNPENPILKSTIPLMASYDIICYNGLAIVSAKDGIHQYNYSNPNQIVKLSKFGY